jgi:hypothetical protein
LVDKARRVFQIDLNRVPFVLQKKGKELLYPSLQTLSSNGSNTSLIDEVIESYLLFHKKRIGLCIADHDRDIKRNYCWNGGQVQYIDPARCFYEPKLLEPKRRSLEWWKATHRLRKWIHSRFPGRLARFDARVKELEADFEKETNQRLSFGKG